MIDSCSSLSKLIEKYFDREITNRERLVVESHLKACSACRDVLTSMEGMKTLIKDPVEEAARQEDFPWIWQKIEREIRSQGQTSWWQSLRSWMDPSPLFKKKVWIPAVAMVAILLFVSIQVIFKKIPSHSETSVVEYVESEIYNIMVYESEKATVIWLFDGEDQKSSAT